MGKAARLACWTVVALLASGCGIRGVEGHYAGNVTGTLTVIGIPFPVNGDLGFDLMHASANLYEAAGDLVVRRKTDGSVSYQATLSGSYAAGSLSLQFTATDGKSSGTMTASTMAGQCFNLGTWTITGALTGGSGSWTACR